MTQNYSMNTFESSKFFKYYFMKKRLGLDIGTNSIGWALVEDEKRILGSGVRIFPEGVVNLGEGEKEISRNSERRQFRGLRKQNFRRKLRKKILLKELSKAGLCPISPNELQGFFRANKFPDSPEMREWFRLNPYLLRAKALKEQLQAEELGRLLYHMAQRRGFQSNSRSARDDKEESVLFTGNQEEGKTGINETQSLIGNSTLGSYLATIYPPDGESYSAGRPRIRNRYTTRAMYQMEFNAIWSAQSKLNPLLSEEMRIRFGGTRKQNDPQDGILFFQRPLRSQKYLIGKCTFEPKKPRCPVSAIPFQYFRLYQFLNTIECNGERLSREEVDTAVDYLTASKTDKKIKDLRKLWKKKDEYYRFNYLEDDKVKNAQTLASLSGLSFNNRTWQELSQKEQEDIWHVLFSFEDKDSLEDYGRKKWKCSEKDLQAVLKIRLEEGYASLSRKAINNILPFLKDGHQYDIAVCLGGIRNAFGNTWDSLSPENKDFIITNVPEIVRSGIKGGYLDELKAFLVREFGFTEKQLNKLYHHSESIRAGEWVEKLPYGPAADRIIQKLRNPVVSTALFELRKVVNALIEKFGKIDEISVELARDLRNPRQKRWQIRMEQNRLERYNEEVKKRLNEHGKVPSVENMLRYKLWEECQHTCPYTGREISITQLFSGEVQIEHIFPWSNSLDDSWLNLTLCFADENRLKGERTPYQHFIRSGKATWEDVKKRVITQFYDTKEFPNRYRKFKRFTAEKFDEEGFIARQLNDTRYISKEATNYLSQVAEKVSVAPGNMTAILRGKWGLNTILSDTDAKDRKDHRHHAIDALVMATYKLAHLQELQKWNKYNRAAELRNFPMPWDSFRQDAELSILSILVSHKADRKVLTQRKFRFKKGKNEFQNTGISARGQLHMDTVYGKRKAPGQSEAYHVRKSLKGLSEAAFPKIVDSRVRALVYDRLRQRGIPIDQKSGKPKPETKEQKEAFKAAFDIPVLLPNRNGDPVPVHKVRISENLGNAANQNAGINRYVNPRNNHHVLIYQNDKGIMDEEVVTFWEAVERRRQGAPLIKLPSNGKSVIMCLKSNDFYFIGLDTETFSSNKNNPAFLSRHLFRGQKFSSKYFEFRLHTEATILRDEMPFFRRIQSMKALQDARIIGCRINVVGEVIGQPVFVQHTNV